MAKQRPNVLVTGTPGTGKSTTCEQIAEATGLQYVDIGSIVKSQELHSGWDDEYSCYIIDEDKVTCRTLPRWLPTFLYNGHVLPSLQSMRHSSS